MMGRRVVPAALVLLLSVVVISADEGRIPIIEQTTISAPGTYMLTRDVSVASGDGIVIASDNVTLDLNEHLIEHQGTTGSVILINNGFTDIVVRNGRLSGGARGIAYGAVGSPIRARIENVEVSDTQTFGIQLNSTEYAEVIGCRVTGVAAGTGIDVGTGAGGVAGGRILGNTVSGAAGLGILVRNLRSGEIRGNHVTGCGNLSTHAGILVDGDDGGGSLIADNLVSDVTGDGIAINNLQPHNVLRDNVAIGNSEHGIVANSRSNVLIGNTASGNTKRGIWVGHPESRCRVVRNQVVQNGTEGLFLAGVESLVEGNVIENNGTWGISFAGSDHAYRDNMLRGNKSGAVDNAAAATDAGGNIQ